MQRMVFRPTGFTILTVNTAQVELGLNAASKLTTQLNLWGQSDYCLLWNSFQNSLQDVAG